MRNGDGLYCGDCGHVSDTPPAGRAHRCDECGRTDVVAVVWDAERDEWECAEHAIDEYWNILGQLWTFVRPD